MHRRGFKGIIVYLGDLLIIAPILEECQQAFGVLCKLLCNLGFQISPGKVVPPSQLFTFLGIQIDTVNLELSLPQEKLVETKALVQEFSHKKRANKHQLQCLAGKLNRASRVVYGGRTFLRRIIDHLNCFHNTDAKFLLTAEFRLDIMWWHTFLQSFNGKRQFFNKLPVVDVQTDACTIGVGAYFRGDWVYSCLPLDFPLHASLHITYKEAFAIYLAARRWGPAWANHHIIIHNFAE